MKLAMAQMQMDNSVGKNLSKTLDLISRAGEAGADLIFFPELQLTPFFPQYEKQDATPWLMTLDGPEVAAIREACWKSRIYASPNLYLRLGERRYDASLMIDSSGELLGVSKMVHITQARNFYEQDYYSPSDDGFKVYMTPFGRIGIVICFDRHLPGSVRRCAKQGAELVIIPTANVQGEPLELFEWEVRVQAFQNTVFAAMCNRVGTEGAMSFAGQSLLAAPNGELAAKAGEGEELLLLDVPLKDAAQQRAERPWLTF